MRAHTLLVLWAGLGGCSRDCPPGSSRHGDGLCHLDDTEATGTDTATDTGEPLSWAPLPEGCGLSSGGADPLTLVGERFLQDGHFIELTDLTLSDSGRTAFSVGQGGLTVVDLSDPGAPAIVYSGRGIEGTDMRFDHIETGEDGALYAVSSFGFTVFDGGDIAAPRQVERLNTTGLAGLARSGDTLYITSSSSGLLVYDVSDPLAPALVREVSGLSSPWRPAVQGDHLYVADNSAAVVVYDISTPSSPALTATVAAAGGAQEVAFSSDGATMYAAVGGAGVEVFSLADPAAPASLGTIDLGYSVISVDTAGDLLWAANQQDVVAFDISAPQQPQLLNSEQTTQWAMHVAATGSLAVVADWGYIAVYGIDATIAAPDMSPSTKRVYLSEGDTITLTARNLGGAPLSLLGAEGDGVLVEATAETIASGAAAQVRLSFTGSAADTEVCLSTNDPDEPDHSVQIIATSSDDPRAGVGKEAPDFTLTDLDGQQHTLSDQRGKPVVLAYFATW